MAKETDRLQVIFDHKRVSSKKFRLVQKKHKLMATKDPLKADWKTREGAIELHKGIHWINLELCEVIEAKLPEVPEELADVLHFLVEFCILCGLDYDLISMKDVTEGDRLDLILNASARDPFVFTDMHTNARFCMHAALHVADMIKNKPWKQTLKKVRDEDEFLNRVRGLWYWFGATVRTANLTAEQLFDQFVRKEKINNKRVDTGV